METVLEAFDENPFLSDFYGDRSRYAFQTQLFFLLSRYRQQQLVPERLQRGALLADYIFEKDRMFAHLNIQGVDELEMYDRLYEALAEKIRPPDLVVYLRAKVDTLMARIARRDRTFERQMDREYIAALRRAYERLFAGFEAVPLLVIESDEMDFVQNPDDLDAIEQQILSALAGVRQPMLPRISLPASPPDAVQRPPVSQEAPAAVELQPSEAQWRAVEGFLALAEAVGRVGGALTTYSSHGAGSASPDRSVGDPVQAALREARGALQRLADQMGAGLDD
jgi:deoxyguanosine kinase